MTTKRDKKDQPKARRPKLTKETVKDLETGDKGEGIKGGRRVDTQYCQVGNEGGATI